MAVYDTLWPKIHPAEGPPDIFVGSGGAGNGYWQEPVDYSAKQPAYARK